MGDAGQDHAERQKRAMACAVRVSDHGASVAKLRKNKRADQDDVQKHWRRCRGGEFSARVQDAGKERGERDEHEIDKHDPPKRNGRVEAHVVRESAGHCKNKPRHEDRAENREDDQDQRQPRQGVPREAAGILADLQLLCEHGHESHVEGAFRKEPAKHVGKGEGHEECFRHRAASEPCRDQDVAGKAEYARQERPCPHRHGTGYQPNCRHGVAAPRCFRHVASKIMARRPVRHLPRWRRGDVLQASFA